MIVSPEHRPRPPVALALVALALAPLALLASFYADQLGLGPGELAWTAVLLLAGGHVGILGALMWSLVLGCVAAGAILATHRARPDERGVGGRDRGHHPRPALLRRARLARRDRVGPAALGPRTRRRDHLLISGVYAAMTHTRR